VALVSSRPPRPFTIRTYDGPVIDYLYPGEAAHAIETRVHDRQVIVSRWLVEPAPGFLAALTRTKYRIRARVGMGRVACDVTTE
jgi:hypothetical protein